VSQPHPGSGPLPRWSLRSELRSTLILAAPIVAGHVGHMLMGLTDTLMIGRVGVVELAAVAFSQVIFHVAFIGWVGALTAVSVLVAHAHGGGDERAAGAALRLGCWIGLIGGVATAACVVACFPLLAHLGQPPDVIAACKPYLAWILGSMPLAFVWIAWRNFSEAKSSPWPAFWAGLAGVLLNVLLNWLLIFGKLGLPELGLTGAGIATWIGRAFTLGLMIVWMYRDARFSDAIPDRWLAPIDRLLLRQFVKLGSPVALQLLLEVGAFSAAAFFMGWIDVTALAAHQIAITCAAITFMVPLGLSIAVTIRIGQVLGAGQHQRVASIGGGIILFTLAIEAVFALCFILLSIPIASLFTTDPTVIKLAATLIVIAGAFQLVDGLQVVSIGALRGLKDVRIPTAFVFAAYWLVSLPLGLVLAFPLNLGARGMWIGLSAGLGCAALALSWRFFRQASRIRHFTNIR
jgi:multidrug resistance protein, MATE family